MIAESWKELSIMFDLLAMSAPFQSNRYLARCCIVSLPQYGDISDHVTWTLCGIFNAECSTRSSSSGSKLNYSNGRVSFSISTKVAHMCSYVSGMIHQVPAGNITAMYVRSIPQSTVSSFTIHSKIYLVKQST